jgi:uncharacterized membrane protein YtjA (UPF0391 family)
LGAGGTRAAEPIRAPSAERAAELEFTAQGTTGDSMNVLRYAAVFLVIAIAAALMGIGGVAQAADAARILFFLFLTVAAVMLVLGLIGGRNDPTD